MAADIIKRYPTNSECHVVRSNGTLFCRFWLVFIPIQCKRILQKKILKNKDRNPNVKQRFVKALGLPNSTWWSLGPELTETLSNASAYKGVVWKSLPGLLIHMKKKLVIKSHRKDLNDQ